MTSKTWVGRGNNNARNPHDWSPNGAPQPGDALIMHAGTMNIRGTDLAGDSLAFNVNAAPTTLYLSHGAVVGVDVIRGATDHVTVNVQGSDTLNVLTGYPSAAMLVVNLADHSTLTAAFTMAFGSIDVNGGVGSRLVNNGSAWLGSTDDTFRTSVQGTGSFTIGTAQSAGLGRLEFGGSVSPGQTVIVNGNAFDGPTPRLQIDQPGAFNGAVVLEGHGEVDLLGLNADSYQFKNDILSIYSGSAVIESLRLTTPPPNTLANGGGLGLTVAQTATGIVIDRGSFSGVGTVLHEHGPSTLAGV